MSNVENETSTEMQGRRMPAFGRYGYAAVAAALALMVAPLAQAAVPQAVAQSCMVCHGMTGGDTLAAQMPRLNGQQEQYIAQQLKQFKGRARGDRFGELYMWPVAQALSGSEIQALAKYYSSQAPMQGAGGSHPGNAAMGKTIYFQGVSSAGVPACMACHAMNAGGRGTFPRLAGQRYGYIMQQLKYFHDGTRVSPVMQPIASKLNGAQMQDVAAYLSSLR